MVKKIYSRLEIQEKKKEVLKKLFAPEKSHLTLTSHSAESDFQVIFSTYKEFIQQTGRTHLLAIESEDKTILGPIQSLETFGIQGKLLPTNAYGQLTREILFDAIKPRAAMLSLSWANRFTGVIHPVWDIMEICKEKEIKLHLNLNAVMGKLYFQLQEIEADFFTFEGIIISKEPFTLAFEDDSANPLEQLDHLNHTLIKSVEQIDHLSTETARLRDKLESGMAEMIPGCQIPFQYVHRLPHIGVIVVPGVGGEALLYLLYTQGICANRYGQNGVSFELSATTTEQEVDRIIEAVSSTAKKLQTYSSKLC